MRAQSANFMLRGSMTRSNQADSGLRVAFFMVALASLCLLLLMPRVSLAADKGAVRFIGGTGAEGGQFSYPPPEGIAVNQQGAGGVSAGDIYVDDTGGDRVQEFSEQGEFVRAFGRGVGGLGVDVCTDRSNCREGEPSGAGGGLDEPSGIAIDQQTGTVFVADALNNRVDIFSAEGVFEGAFGWAVDLEAPAGELQLCTVATGCQAGSKGAGPGQIDLDRLAVNSIGIAVNPVDGDLILSDIGNRRIDDFAIHRSAGSIESVSFVHAFGWGVVDGAAESQVCTTNCAVGYASPRPCLQGEPLGEGLFSREGPGAVAVDESGQIFVADGHYGRADIFSSAGMPEGQLGLRADIETCADGNLLLGLTLDQSDGRLLLYGEPPNTGGSEAETAPAVAEFETDGTLIERYPPGLSLIYGMAVAESSKTLYFTYRDSTVENGVVVIGTPVPPIATVAAPTDVTGTTATFNGTVNPTDFFTTFGFEYSADGSTWTQGGTRQEREEEESSELSRKLPADEANHAVSQGAEGLEAHTEYSVRLVASKSLNGGVDTDETTFVTGASPPRVTSAEVVRLSDQSASLTSTVNPEQEAASFAFQCTSEESYEAEGWSSASEMPLGGGSLPAGGPQSISVTFEGLRPFTAYLCRVLASNPTGAVESQPIRLFTFETQPAGLPDGRVYEQATPTDKNAADARGANYLVGAAPDGAAVTYYIPGGNGGAGAQDFPTYHADRVDGAWQNFSFLPPASAGAHAIVSGWSDDLRYSYVTAWNSGQSGSLLRYDTVTGTVRTIASVPASHLPPHGPERFYDGEGRGSAVVVFESPLALTDEAREGVNNVYAWNSSSGAISLVSMLEAETPSPTGGFVGSYEWSVAEPKAGGAQNNIFAEQLHAVSEDGETVFFTTPNVAQLYARQGIGGPDPTTLHVSASQKTNGSGSGGRDPHGTGKAAFMEATPDGRYVFFTSPEELTDDATTGTADQGNDLYRFDTETGSLIDLAPDTTDPDGAEVQGVLGSSADGSYVYFVANGRLAGDAEAGDCTASAATGVVAGNLSQRCNLYVWHEGSVGLVSEMNGGDGQRGGASNWVAGGTGVGGSLAPRTAGVSGDSLLFTTTLELTAPPEEPGGAVHDGLEEVYRYDPAEGLLCVSCNPTGVPAKMGASLHTVHGNFSTPFLPQPFLVRNIVDGGRRAFFDTAEQLVAADHNSVTDVYEWEQDGTGSCSSSSDDGGCLFLVSTGTGSTPSYYADANLSGDDAFFFTRQELVGQDEDQLQDVYDARVGGGLASQDPQHSVTCDGEACADSAAPPPAPAAANSSSYVSPGNPSAAGSCKKGYVKKKGRCVKPKKSKKKKPKKSKKKKSKNKKASKNKAKRDHERTQKGRSAK
jgi:hypothetical protein